MLFYTVHVFNKFIGKQPFYSISIVSDIVSIYIDKMILLFYIA